MQIPLSAVWFTRRVKCAFGLIRQVANSGLRSNFGMQQYPATLIRAGVTYTNVAIASCRTLITSRYSMHRKLFVVIRLLIRMEHFDSSLKVCTKLRTLVGDHSDNEHGYETRHMHGGRPDGLDRFW
jgi:hypothetical protein